MKSERSTSLEVRRARESDAAKIVEIIRASFESNITAATIYGSPRVGRWVEDKIRSESDRLFLCAWDQGKIVGCIDLSVGGVTPLLSYIAVSPPDRGRGIGAAMLRQAIETELGPGRSLYLDVFQANEIARAWYARLGLRQIDSGVWCDGTKELREATASDVSLSELGSAQARYGFSECEVLVPSGSYRVGRLGERWWRLKAEGPALDPGSCRDLLGALHQHERHRGLLVLASSGWGDSPVFTRTLRLSGATDTILARLGS